MGSDGIHSVCNGRVWFDSMNEGQWNRALIGSDEPLQFGRICAREPGCVAKCCRYCRVDGGRTGV